MNSMWTNNGGNSTNTSGVRAKSRAFKTKFKRRLDRDRRRSKCLVNSVLQRRFTSYLIPGAVPALRYSNQHSGPRDVKRRLVIHHSNLPIEINGGSSLWIASAVDVHHDLQHHKSPSYTATEDIKANARLSRIRISRVSIPEHPKRKDPAEISQHLAKRHKTSSPRSTEQDLTQNEYRLLFPGLAFPRKHEQYRFGSDLKSSLLEFTFENQSQLGSYQFNFRFYSPGWSLSQYQHQQTSEQNELRQVKTECVDAHAVTASSTPLTDLPSPTQAVSLGTPVEEKVERSHGVSSVSSLTLEANLKADDQIVSTPVPIKEEQNATSPSSPSSVLRNPGDLRQAVQDVGIPGDYTPISLENLGKFRPSRLGRRFIAACTLEQTDRRGMGNIVRDIGNKIVIMVRGQYGLWLERLGSERMRGPLRFNWEDDFDQTDAHSHYLAFAKLLYMEVVNDTTWEGIPPTDVRETVSHILSGTVANPTAKYALASFGAESAKAMANAKGLQDLSRFGIDTSNEPSGLLDLYYDEIVEILDSINSVLIIRASKTEGRTPRGPWHRSEWVKYSSWLAQAPDSESVPQRFQSIHGKVKQAEEQGQAKILEDRLRSRQHGKKVGFAPDVSCRTFDIESRETEGDSIIPLTKEFSAGERYGVDAKNWSRRYQDFGHVRYKQRRQAAEEAAKEASEESQQGHKSEDAGVKREDEDKTAQSLAKVQTKVFLNAVKRNIERASVFMITGS